MGYRHDHHGRATFPPGLPRQCLALAGLYRNFRQIFGIFAVYVLAILLMAMIERDAAAARFLMRRRRFSAMACRRPQNYAGALVSRHRGFDVDCSSFTS